MPADFINMKTGIGICNFLKNNILGNSICLKLLICSDSDAQQESGKA